MFELPKLPYANNGLEPYFSEETLNYHYGKHHQTYVTNLNNLVKGTEFESQALEEIIKSNPSAGVFNNAAQIYNHSFYFLSFGLNNSFDENSNLGKKIAEDFGSLQSLQEKINQMAVGNFGSGWTWLVINADHKLEVINTSNAETPITKPNLKPLLCVDVWEHAYYIDYRNSRPEYLKNFWQVINWRVIENRFNS